MPAAKKMTVVIDMESGTIDSVKVGSKALEPQSDKVVDKLIGSKTPKLHGLNSFTFMATESSPMCYWIWDARMRRWYYYCVG